MHPRSDAARRGFSLLELIITLAVLAGGATTFIVFYFQRSSVTLENAVALLEQDLRVAQTLAMAAGKPVTVRFNEFGYSGFDSAGRKLIHPRTGLEFERDYERDAVFEGVRVSQIDLGGDNETSFDSGGHATEKGHVRLAFLEDERGLRIDPKLGILNLD